MIIRNCPTLCSIKCHGLHSYQLLTIHLKINGINEKRQPDARNFSKLMRVLRKVWFSYVALSIARGYLSDLIHDHKVTQ